MIRIYGVKQKLNPIKEQLSDVINQCMVDALKFPDNKRAHRFFPMNLDDFSIQKDELMHTPLLKYL